MPLLYRMITKDKSLADILNEHNQPQTLVGEPEKLNSLLIDNGYQPIDFTIEDNRRESRFVAFLDKHYEGKLKETLYIDYTESLSADRMAKFVNQAVEYKMPIETLVNDYINAERIDIKRIYRSNKKNDLLKITITERNDS